MTSSLQLPFSSWAQTRSLGSLFCISDCEGVRELEELSELLRRLPRTGGKLTESAPSLEKEKGTLNHMTEPQGITLGTGSGPLERTGSHSAIPVGLNLNDASQADLELKAILLLRPPDCCITGISLHTQLPRRYYLR